MKLNERDINIKQILEGWILSANFCGEFYSKMYFNCTQKQAIEQFKDFVEEQEFENALFNILDITEDDDD